MISSLDFAWLAYLDRIITNITYSSARSRWETFLKKDVSKKPIKLLLRACNFTKKDLLNRYFLKMSLQNVCMYIFKIKN